MVDNHEIIENLLNKYSRKLSHAYLFVTSGNFDYKDLLIKFIIKILFGDKTENYDLLYNQIMSDSYPEVKIIKADGLWIKKEQLSELKKQFSTKSLNSSKKVYIINEAEKLNLSSANSLLKFLEEPEDNIVAILTTNNLSNVLSTIASRCQIINLQGLLNNDNQDLYNIFKDYIPKEKFYLDNYGKNFIDNSMSFIIKLEEKKTKMISFTENSFHKKFVNREEIEIALQIMILFYKDVLRYLYSKDITYFKDFIENIVNVSKSNSDKMIIEKIDILNKKKELIKNNVNINLLIDTLIFDIGGLNK